MRIQNVSGGHQNTKNKDVTPHPLEEVADDLASRFLAASAARSRLDQRLEIHLLPRAAPCSAVWYAMRFAWFAESPHEE